MALEPRLSQPHDRGQAVIIERLYVPDAVPFLRGPATQ